MPAKTFEDYARELENLVEAAREAIVADDLERIKAAHGALASFQCTSDDLIHGVSELDDVAANAMRDLTLARLDKALVKNLSDRSSDIAGLIKKFSTQAAVNDSVASALRLERTKSLLTAGVNVVAELKKFSDFVDTTGSDGKKLARALQDAIDAVAAVQKQVAGAG